MCRQKVNVSCCLASLLFLVEWRMSTFYPSVMNSAEVHGNISSA